MNKIFLTIIIFSLLSSSLFGQVTKLKDLSAVGTNSRKIFDRIGNSVAISDDIIVVSSHLHDFNENGVDSLNDAGAVYIFSRNEGGTNNWGLVKKLVGNAVNNRFEKDYFGSAVAISGDIIAVSAGGQDYDENGLDSVNNAGAVYLFSKDEGGADNWGLIKKFTSKGQKSRMEGDGFGSSIAFSGNTMVIGATGHEYDADGNNSIYLAGSAYIYSKDAGGINNWGFVKKLVPSGTNARNSGDFFGYSVAILGEFIFVGAMLHDYDENGTNKIDNTGAVYIFSQNEGGPNNWGQLKKIVGPKRNKEDYFGNSIAASENLLVVGAPFYGYDSLGTNLLKSGTAFIYSKDEGGINNWGLLKEVA